MCEVEPSAESYGKQILKRIRGYIKEKGLDDNRLPKWTQYARLKHARLKDSHIFLIEDSPAKNDNYKDSSDVLSDIQFLLELPEFVPRGSCLQAPRGQGMTVMVGHYDGAKSTIMDIVSERSSWFDIGYAGYHCQLAVVNMFIRLSNDVTEECIAIRFIPCAIFIHNDDLNDLDGFLENCEIHIGDCLKFIHDSEMGDFHESEGLRADAFLVNKKTSVIVLGSYSDSARAELLQVRDHLRTAGYRASLIEDLGGLPEMSNEAKVRLWTSASRFCVMIDSEPAGQIAEYEYLKSQSTIFAILRPGGKASTSMIADGHLIDFGFIESFKFRDSPLEIIDTAIDWAEDLIRKRTAEYGKIYP